MDINYELGVKKLKIMMSNHTYNKKKYLKSLNCHQDFQTDESMLNFYYKIQVHP